MNTLKEIRNQINHFQKLLKHPDLDFTSQCWIELQLNELRKELREEKIKKQTKKLGK